MQTILSWIATVSGAVSAFVWGPPMLALFLGVGVFFTVRTRGLQFRRLGRILLSPFQGGGRQAEGRLSAFSAVSGALAGTLGIGNIVGVAGALQLGGPGIVFWMVSSAFLCMILKYAETVLAMKFRVKNARGETVGGPMYYMRDGLGLRLMPVVFCVLCILTALIGAGNVTQIGTVAHAMEDTFQINALWVSAACAIAIALMTGGGVRRLGSAFSLLTPFMSALFLSASVLVLCGNISRLPGVMAAIFESALSPGAMAGGVGAYTLLAAMKYGVSRGVFSNEAGMGSSPIIHATSDNTPVLQGMCGAFEVFFDTVVMAGLTALAILTSGVPLAGGSATTLTIAAFSTVFGRLSAPGLTLMLAIFAVSSVPCWYFYGEKCVEYLFPTGGGAKRVYRAVFLALAAACPLLTLDGMWQIADSLNGLMAVPNLAAVLMLQKEVVALTAGYDAHSALRHCKPPGS